MRMRSVIACSLACYIALSPLSAPLTARSDDAAPASPAAATPTLATTSDPATVAAKEILAGGPPVRAAILKALQSAGMPVRNPDGSYLEWPTGANQHIGFEAWEIDAMTKASSSGSSSLPLNSLATAIRGMMPVLKNADVAGFLVNGIRADAKSADPALRFWAELIIAIGREGYAHYDLTNNVDTARVSFDAVQTSLILRRLAGDWYQLARSKRAVSPRRPVVVADAGARDTRPPQQVAASRPACSVDEQTAEMMELGGAIQGNAFDQFMEWLSEVEGAEHGAERAGNIMGGVNIAITYAELLLTYLALLDFKMEIKNEPLVRNKTRPPGQQRDLIATAYLHSKNWTWKNCIKNALANLGIDTGSVFVDGPVKDGAVDWTLTEGNAIVEFAGQLASRVPLTDGESKIVVQGKARPEDLPDGVVDVSKHATAAGLLQLQRANMRSDFISALDTPRSILAFLKVPAELIKRTTLFTKAASVGFKVIDYKLDLQFIMNTELTRDSTTCCPVVQATDQFHFHTTVPLTYEAITPVNNRSHAILGQAPSDFYGAVNLHYIAPCHWSISGKAPGDVVVVIDPADLKTSNGNFRVRVSLSLPQTEDTLSGCFGLGGPKTLPLFTTYFEMAHRSELAFKPVEGAVMSVFDLNDWSPGIGSVIAQKDVQRSNIDCGSKGHYQCTVMEVTTFKLQRNPPAPIEPLPQPT